MRYSVLYSYNGEEWIRILCHCGWNHIFCTQMNSQSPCRSLRQLRILRERNVVKDVLIWSPGMRRTIQQ